ncbi:MAG: magnesium transporter [Bacteroidota bacterium]
MSNLRKDQEKIARVRRLLEMPKAPIRKIIGTLHPTEVALVLEECEEEMQKSIVRQLPRELISQAIAEMDEETNPGELLTLLHPEAAAELVNELEPDDAADLLAQISEEHKDSILRHVPREEKVVINQLLTYDDDTAGGLMNPELVKVQENWSTLVALKEVVKQSEEMEAFYAIYVVNDAGQLTGYLTFKALVLSRKDQQVQEVMESDVVSVEVNMDQEEVARKMSQYNLPTLPVVNDNHELIGRVTFDDIMDVMEDENTEDILNFAGVSENASLRGGWADSVKSRIPWLMVNLMTASLAAFVISRFEDTLSKIVVITFYMPIIAGVAGNGATQTLAVTIRRISTDGIPPNKAVSVILKEVGVGIINGLMIGAIASMIAIATNSNPMIGLVVFFAMCANLMIAGLAGSFFPILLERLGVDPAVASSILITAFTDVIGYILLFGLATLVLL